MQAKDSEVVGKRCISRLGKLGGISQKDRDRDKGLVRKECPEVLTSWRKLPPLSLPPESPYLAPKQRIRLPAS